MEVESVTIIRTARVEDADATLTLHRDIVKEDIFLEPILEEFTRTVEEQERWIRQLREDERKVAFVAEVEGEIVGWIAFSSPDRLRLAHTGTIGILVKNGYRDKGIGKLLMQALLDWATEHPSIEKVSLGVFASNHRAIALYEKMGFVEEARLVKAYKCSESEYIDGVVMAKLI
jgi:RimJ/RimL family protein N-acetyltransferase